jgi:hypothetical protein
MMRMLIINKNMYSIVEQKVFVALTVLATALWSKWCELIECDAQFYILSFGMVLFYLIIENNMCGGCVMSGNCEWD